MKHFCRIWGLNKGRRNNLSSIITKFVLRLPLKQMIKTLKFCCLFHIIKSPMGCYLDYHPKGREIDTVSITLHTV
jgi:hypothetical protein